MRAGGSSVSKDMEPPPGHPIVRGLPSKGSFHVRGAASRGESDYFGRTQGIDLRLSAAHLSENFVCVLSDIRNGGRRGGDGVRKVLNIKGRFEKLNRLAICHGGSETVALAKLR